MLTTLESNVAASFERYSQLLGDVSNTSHAALVYRALWWLAFSTRPLYIDELAELSTIENTQPKRINTNLRPANAHGIQHIFPGLLVATPPSEPQLVQLADPLIKSFLTSTASPSRGWMTTQSKAHASIAEDCLIYLLQFDRPYTVTPEKIKSSPLLRYAANYWAVHLKAAGSDANGLIPLITEFFDAETAYLNWTAFFGGHLPFDDDGNRSPTDPPGPLYYAASFGLTSVVKHLIDARGMSATSACGGEAGSPLAAAALAGHAETVTLLIERGADVNTIGPLGSPLVLAAGAGHVGIVEALLDQGLDGTSTEGKSVTALMEAKRRGQSDVVRALLARMHT